MAATIIVTPAAQKKIEALPRVIQARAMNIVARLVEWPAVSGAKPLRGELAGNYRIRTGDYRLIFKVSPEGQTVTIWNFGNRGDIYD